MKQKINRKTWFLQFLLIIGLYYMYSGIMFDSSNSFTLFALLPGFLLLFILLKAITKFIYAFVYAYKQTNGGTQFEKILEQKNEGLKSSFKMEYYIMLFCIICSLLFSGNWQNTLTLVVFVIVMVILNHYSK